MYTKIYDPNTKNYTEKDVLEEIKELQQIFKEQGWTDVTNQTYEIKIYKSRGSRVLGFCKCLDWLQKRYLIKLNEDYLRMTEPQKVHNTIAHEFLHSIPGCMNHKSPWKKMASLLMDKYPQYNISRVSNSGEYAKLVVQKEHKNKHKYIMYCGSCDAQWPFQRLTQKRMSAISAQRLICPHCGGIIYCSQLH